MIVVKKIKIVHEFKELTAESSPLALWPVWIQHKLAIKTSKSVSKTLPTNVPVSIKFLIQRR